MAAIFPAAVVTQAQLWTAVNGISTQLTIAINDLVTTLNVVDTTNFPSTGYVVIDQEIISYTGKTGTSFTGCTRGADGSTAASHTNSSTVSAFVVADHHNILTLEMRAVEQNISDRWGLSSSAPTTQAFTKQQVDLVYATAGSTARLGVRHTETANAASHAQLYVESGGASGGDPFVLFTVSGANSWSVGLDNSASDAFVVAGSTALGTTNALSIALSQGAWTITSNDVSVAKSVSGAFVRAHVENLSNTASSDAQVDIYVAGSLGGDAYIKMSVDAGSAIFWAIGIDNSDSDAFVISAASTLGTSNTVRITSSQVTSAVDFAVSRAASGANVKSRLENTSNTASANAQFEIYTAGATADDPKVVFSVDAGSSIFWSIGIDNSASDAFVVSRSSALGTNNAISISTANLVTIGSLSATLGANLAAATFKITGLTAGSATGEAAVFEQTAQTGDIKATGILTITAGWLECDGSAVSRSTYAALFAAMVSSATITVTIASPGVVTWTAHGLRNNMPVKFTTTGALPTGIVSGTTYYIINKATDTFQIAATPGGTAINTTGSQSGTHTGFCAPWGTGDGSTTFNVPDFRGRGPIGAGTYTDSTSGSITRGVGQTIGEEAHVLSTAEMPSHNHNVYNDNDVAGSAGGGPRVRRQGSSNTNYADMTLNTGGGGSHNNMQPSLGVTWIIKT